MWPRADRAEGLGQALPPCAVAIAGARDGTPLVYFSAAVASLTFDARTR
jgi:hypothetical protein